MGVAVPCAQAWVGRLNITVVATRRAIILAGEKFLKTEVFGDNMVSSTKFVLVGNSVSANSARALIKDLRRSVDLCRFLEPGASDASDNTRDATEVVFQECSGQIKFQ